MGEYQEALQDYATLLTLHPNDAIALYNRGITYSLLHQYESAIADYTAALKLRPTDVVAYSSRAVAYGKINKWQEAAADFDAYLRLKPDDLDALKNKGIAYYDAFHSTVPPPANPATDANLKAALNALLAYDLKRPGDPTVTKLIGALYGFGSIGVSAIQRLEGAFAKNPADANVAYNIGFAFLNSKPPQNEKAAEWFTKSYLLKPDDGTLMNRAIAYYNLGIAGNRNDYDLAIADATTLIDSDPNNAPALLLRADIYFDRKWWREARADYERALKLHLRDNEKQTTLYQLISSAINDKDYSGVIGATSRAIFDDSSEARNYLYRGKAYQRKDETVNAAASFEKAVALAPDYADAAFQAGRSYQTLGDENKKSARAPANAYYDKAIAMYDRVIASPKATPKQRSDALYNKAVCIENKAIAA